MSHWEASAVIALLILQAALTIIMLVLAALMFETMHRLDWQRQVFVPWMNNIGQKIGLDNAQRIPDPPSVG